MANTREGRNLILLHTIGFLILPIFSLFISILNYKNRLSQLFFVLFAFYFGWQCDLLCGSDLATHCENFRHYFVGNSLGHILSTPEVYMIGKEPYHIIFKYLVAQISSNSHFFSACAAAVYSIFFLYFFQQLSCFYNRRQLGIHLLLICAIVVTVEFYWYCGLRYWTAAFFFLAFFLKYIKTDKRKYLYLSFCAVLFHVALGIIIIPVILGLILQNHKKYLYGFVVCCIVLGRSANSILYYVQMFPFLRFVIKDTYFNSNLIDATNATTEYFRNEGNIVYQNRTNVIFGVAALIFYLLWRRNKNVNDQYPKFYSVLLALFGVTNLLYMSIVAYERTYKLFMVLFLTYLYFLLQSKRNLWINANLFIRILLLLVVTFLIMTPLVEFRRLFMDLTIWFGNIWTL